MVLVLVYVPGKRRDFRNPLGYPACWDKQKRVGAVVESQDGHPLKTLVLPDGGSACI